MPVRVIVHYRVNGVLRDWVTVQDRVNHIISVCLEKGFEVVGVESLS